MNIGYWLLEYELDQMSRYLDLIQLAFQNYGQEIEESYIKDMKAERTEDARAFLEADYEDLFIEAGQDFPRLLLSSFIVSWYSFVERELLNFCEKLKLTISIRPRENDYFGTGIRRSRKFLLKAKKYKIDALHWQELVNISKVRNKIVHSGNRVHCSYNELEENITSYTIEHGEIYIALEKSLFDYLQKHHMLEINGPPFVEIVPNPAYCEYLVKYGKDLFYKLYIDMNPGSQILTRKGI